MAEENRQGPEGLAGRRALVTGGASGIGLASATALARAGADVTIADVDEQAAGQAARALGGKAWAVDLSDTKSLEELSLDIDILVNNAGVQRVAPIHEFDPEAWRLIHRLMLESPFLLIRAALPGMRERGFGRIINISSIHGLRASAFKSAYVAAKHLHQPRVCAHAAGPEADCRSGQGPRHRRIRGGAENHADRGGDQADGGTRRGGVPGGLAVR